MVVLCVNCQIKNWLFFFLIIISYIWYIPYNSMFIVLYISKFLIYIKIKTNEKREVNKIDNAVTRNSVSNVDEHDKCYE